MSSPLARCAVTLLAISCSHGLAASPPAGLACPSLVEVRVEEGPGEFVDIAVDGDLLVSLDDYGLSTWKLEDGIPRYLASWTVGHGEEWYGNESVHLDGRGYAYVVDGGLTIYDVRDPLHPQPIWRSPPGATWHGVEYGRPDFDFSGHRGARLGDFGSLFIVDFEDPLHPVEREVQWVGSTRPIAMQLRFAGDLLLVEDNFIDMRLYVCDVTDPQAARVVGEADLSTLDLPDGLYASADLALLVPMTYIEGNFYAVDLVDPGHPQVCRLDLDDLWYATTDVELVGRVAYACGYSERRMLQKVDLTDPSAPTVVATRECDSCWHVAHGEDGLLHLSGHYGLQVLDSSTLATVGATPDAGYLENFAIQGGLGVMAIGPRGLAVYDVTDLRRPSRLAVLDLPGYTEKVALAGTAALATCPADGLFLVNVAEPSAPRMVAQVAFEQRVEDVAAEDGIAVVATGHQFERKAIEVVDFTTGTELTHLATFSGSPTTQAWCNRVDLRDRIAYWASDRWLTIVSLHDPTAPTALAELELDVRYGGAYDVVLAGDLAIIAAGYDTIAVDVSDPLAPAVCWQSEMRSWDLGASGALVAISGRPYTLADFSQPEQPLLRAFHPMRTCWGATIAGDTMLVPDGPFLEIYDLACTPPHAGFEWQASELTAWLRFAGTSWWEQAEWDFGDGESSTELDVRHQYAEKGTYTVTLTLTSPFGEDSFSRNVVVGASPTPRRPSGRH